MGCALGSARRRWGTGLVPDPAEQHPAQSGHGPHPRGEDFRAFASLLSQRRGRRSRPRRACIAVDGSPIRCELVPPIVPDTAPENASLTDSEVVDNGSSPPPGPFEALGSDILGIGGSNNCASGNIAGTTILTPELPAC
ncbi:MAG: hypothetical protein FJ144_11705 [Deltaproteobacteria bacterium]|nr:hypothetical protein [Deltaproteobacteria bacterium]